jgi:hypothetical protein
MEFFKKVKFSMRLPAQTCLTGAIAAFSPNFSTIQGLVSKKIRAIEMAHALAGRLWLTME